MHAFDDDRPAHAPWRQLLVADRLAATGHFTDAFAMYRSVLNELPSMTSIHESVARVYERTGHRDWAIRERRLGVVPAEACAVRPALCEFRAGRYDAVLRATLAATDPESRYWRARAATELALAAFARLDTLPDSPERHATRAATARAEDRHQDAIAEWAAALKLAPGSPALVYEFASSHYAARDFEQTVATLAPLLQANPADVRFLKLTGYALVHLRKVDEAVPVLERAIALDPSDPGPQLALGRAHVHRGAFAAAVPLIEPHLAADQDGSLHVQLARAYAGIGQRERSDALLARSQELNRASEERSAAAVRRRIAPPK
jgi:predicted Zn-dependent protease